MGLHEGTDSTPLNEEVIKRLADGIKLAYQIGMPIVAKSGELVTVLMNKSDVVVTDHYPKKIV